MSARLPAGIAPQLAQVRAILERRLAGTLQAVHLFGSAVDGGLKPHSDIDLLVTVDAPLPEATRRALMADLLDASAWPGTDPALRALEVTVLVRCQVVPWRYPPMRELQFGEWLRDELRAGIVHPPCRDGDLAIMLTKARRHSMNLLGPPASELFDPVPREDFARALAETLSLWEGPQDWAGDERNVVLTLARIWFSVATGGIAPKEAAAAWAMERLPQPHRAVLEKAREAYMGQTMEEPDGQGDDRVARFVRHLKAEIQATRASLTRGGHEAPMRHRSPAPGTACPRREDRPGPTPSGEPR